MAKKSYWKRHNAKSGSITHYTRNAITGTVTTYTESAEQVQARKKKRNKILKLIFGAFFLGGAFVAGNTIMTSVICLAIAALLLWSGLKK